MLNCDRRRERIFARGRTETKEAEILMMLCRGIDFLGFSVCDRAPVTREDICGEMHGVHIQI